MIQTVESYDAVIRGMLKVIQGLKIHPTILTKPEHKYLHQVFDKVMFNALCNLDLITELKYLDISHASGNAYEANFFSRVAAHSCFEILDNLNKTVGRNIIQLVETRLGAEALCELNAQVKELNKVKKSHLADLKRIRNNLFGHKMNAGLEQVEQMVQINPLFIYNIGKRIFHIQMKILEAFLMVLKAI